MSRSDRARMDSCACGKARILTYHRIGLPRYGPYERCTVPPGRFLRQLRVLRALRYKFSTLDAVALWLRSGGRMDRGAVILTFDDGYAELYDRVFPLLREIGAGAVVYLVSGMEADLWRHDSREPLPLLTWPQIREMADAGFVFGSHTATHCDLTRCTARELHEEVRGSKMRIEDELDREVRHLSYPYGACNDRVVDAVREAGYATACTTRKSAVRPGADPLALPRLTVGKRMGIIRFLMRLSYRH